MLLAVASILTTVFVSCNEDPDFSTTPLAVRGAHINDTTASFDTIAVGEVVTLRGGVIPMNASNPAVNWITNESGVATVSNVGVVEAIAPGTATITITTEDGGYQATIEITVVPVEGITLNMYAVELSFGRTGTTQQLTATVQPSGVAIQRVTWHSSNINVATVNSAGLVTATGIGNATITARTVFGDFSTTCEVTVVPSVVTGVTLSRSDLVFEPGDTLTIVATVAPAHAIQNVIWATSNPTVATVSNTGLVTAVTNGVAIITATSVNGGFVAICEVTVGEPCVPTVGPPTVDNIITFCPDPTVQSLNAFLNDGNPIVYEITLMSPRLDAWRTAYATAVAAMPVVANATTSGFDKITIALPFSALPIVGGVISNRSLSVNIHYTSTSNVWPFAPAAEGSPTLVAMTGSGNNPNSDATFTTLVRRDRTPASTSANPPRPATPHSTTTGDYPGNFGFADGSAAALAIRGIFQRTTGSSSAAAPDGNFIGLLNSPAGWTIIQENATTFWFRSKADPTDWFVVVRQ